MNNTYAALVTPQGMGGIAIIQVMGNQVYEIFRDNFILRQNHKLRYGSLSFANGEIIDEILIRSTSTSQNFELVEICCHGGLAITNAIFKWLNDRGIQKICAEKFYSIQNNYSNNHQHILNEFLNAKTNTCARILYYQVNGIWLNFVNNILKEWDNNEAKVLLAKFQKLLPTYALFKKLTEPQSIVIAGKPNSGKSTLFNQIVGRERVIVNAQPGTTRDLIKILVSIDDIPFYIYDTAGIRETNNKVEQMGIAKAKDALEKSDIILWLIDSTQCINNQELNAPPNAIVLLNKVDLSSEHIEKYVKKYQNAICISAQTAKGMDVLIKKLTGNLKEMIEERPFPIIYNEEQYKFINEVIILLQKNFIAEAKCKVECLLKY